MKKSYKKTEEKLTSEGTELRQPVAELEAPAADRKQDEQTLGKTEEGKLAILNSMSEHVVYQDTEYRILWANKAAAESVGLTPAQLVGRYCYEIWAKRSQPCADCPVAKARQTGKPHKAEIATPDGRVWSIRGYPTRDVYGSVTGVVEVTLDITERKQAEEKLQESEEFNSSLLAHSPNPISVINPDTSIRYVNPALEKLTGFSASELTGRKIPYPHWPEETIPETRQGFKEALRHGDERLEKRFRKKNGEQFWVEITCTRVIIDGEFKYLLANWVDITGRKQAEEALQSILKTALDGFWLANLEGKLLEVNDSYCKMIGYTREELLKMSISDLEAAENPRGVAQHIAKVIKQGYHSFDSRHKRKDGKIIDVEISVNYLGVGEGQLFVFARDITERKQAKDALQAEKNKLQSVIDAMADGLHIQDKDYNIIYQNEHTRAFYGDHVGEKCYRVYEGGEKICVGCPIEKAFKDGKSHTAERKVIAPSGEIVYWENTANPIRDAKGEIVSCLEIGRSITGRKQAEEALRESEEKFSKVFHSSANAICITSLKDGKIIEVNESHTRFTGYTRQEVIGRSTAELGLWVDKEERQQWQNVLKENGRAYNEEIHSRMKSGEIRVGLASAETISIGDEPCRIAVIADITDRKQAQEALLRERDLAQTYLDIAGVVILACDLEERVTMINKKGCQVLGYREEEIIGKKWSDNFVPEEAKALETEAFQKMLSGQAETLGYENPVLARNGEEKLILWHDVIFKDEHGKPIGVLSSGEDITERKQAEEALRDSEEKTRKIFESASDGISVVDLNGVITEVNQRTVEMHGFASEDEMIGKNALMLAAPGDREKITKNMRQALRRGIIRDQEYTLVKSDGSEFPAELSTSVLKDAAGKMIGHVTVSRDITERKKAKEALRESVDFSSSLLTNSPNPMLVINKDTSVQYINPALEKLTDFSPKEVIGRKAPYPWWTKETLSKTGNDLEQAMQQGAKRLEELFQKKNGERFWVEITSVPVTSNGEFKYYLSNWVDVTERKQAEEREKELQRELYLASRLAAIGELAAGVAHQINNPLTGVLGFSQRLLKKSTDPETNQALKRIYAEAERAARVVQNLLTFARRRQPQKQYSDINEILESALELQAYELTTSNIEVVTDLAPGLPEIMLDFYQIEEVFLNIVLNAEQALTEAKGGGKLIIKTEEMKEYIRTTFSDNGPGIPAEHLDKIFDPFFTTKGEKGGTGLGLSVCHGIISEHGGKIYAKSKPGKGATFFVELPLAHN